MPEKYFLFIFCSFSFLFRKNNRRKQEEIFSFIYMPQLSFYKYNNIYVWSIKTQYSNKTKKGMIFTRKLIRCCLDYDDVLAYCNAYALEIINKNRKKSEHFQLKNIKSFFTDDGSLKERLKLYNDPEFIASQPLYPGAKEFITALSKKAEIFITSAVPPQCMSARAIRILEDFPEIKPENIILGASKKIYDADIMLDDGSHNVLSSNATYPVLMRRPWNENLSGTLAVNNFDDFLHLIDILFSNTLEETNLSSGGIVCLVGPSGSGKTAVTEELIKEDLFVKPVTTTTRAKRETETDDAYNFVTEEKFLKDFEKGKFLETTVYSGNHYGTSSAEIDKIILKDKIAILPIDICGSITIKNIYREKALLIFIDRSRQEVIMEILNRNVPNEEKMRRIISLDKEYQNETLCDYTVRNNGTLAEVVEKTKEIIKKEYSR